ncbi:MAG: SAM-dependent methyltransferase [Bacteroidetes bacterium]|nr:SAM-dependent methyltransferase [Bacteroidota bacterium]
MSDKQFYLIPSSLGDTSIHKEITEFHKIVLEQIEIIWVENAKPARAFIKSCNLQRAIGSFDIREIPKDEFKQLDIKEISNSLNNASKVGFMSDAGLPCIADPGSFLVNLARSTGFTIIPMVGASSIMLGLMASGLNGQQFVFHGYLPVQPKELKRAIRGMESEILKSGYTQIFIETPYRNDKLFSSLLESLNPQIRLSVAINLLQNDQFTDTKSIAQWAEKPLIFGKRPAVFYLGR